MLGSKYILDVSWEVGELLVAVRLGVPLSMDNFSQHALK